MTTRTDDTRLELESISTAVANLPSEMPFYVPDGYFDRLPDQVLSLVREGGAKQELEELSPLLANLRGINPLSVPEGYFSSISPEMIIPESTVENRGIEEGQAVVRKMTARTLVIRLAAAASIFGMIALAAWLMTNRPEGAPAMETTQLAEQIQGLSFADTLTVSDNALVGFLLEEDILPGEEMLPDTELPESGDLAILDLTETRIQDLLKEIPDVVLESYVAQNPGSDGTMDMN